MSRTSSEVLPVLREAANMERLETEARRFLSLDPDDPVAHYYLAVALLELERPREARHHIDFLLRNDPESSANHLLAIEYHLARNNWRRLRKHVKEGLRIDPEEIDFHYYDALADVQFLRFRRALKRITWAHEQAPHDTDVTALYLQIRGMQESSASDAWTRIEEFENALQHDPESATLHNSLGDVYLEDLADARTAEHHYREAVRLEPRNRIYQHDLFHAVAKRDLIYRLVSLPSRAFGAVLRLLDVVRRAPWLILILLVGIKFVAAFLVWLAVMTPLLWPAGKIYELLLVSELKAGARTGTTNLKLWYRFQRVPRTFRFAFFLAAIAGVHALVFFLCKIPLRTGFTWVGVIILAHFVIISLLHLNRRAGARRARKKAERKRRREEALHSG